MSPLYPSRIRRTSSHDESCGRTGGCYVRTPNYFWGYHQCKPHAKWRRPKSGKFANGNLLMFPNSVSPSISDNPPQTRPGTSGPNRGPCGSSNSSSPSQTPQRYQPRRFRLFIQHSSEGEEISPSIANNPLQT